jgi:hypothetical protein
VAKKKQPKTTRFQWVIEALCEQPSFVQKPMFGCQACYLRGRLMLVIAPTSEEPWRGLLVPTSREHHEALRRDHPLLIIHPILKKWLYLPEATEEFEDCAMAIIEDILTNDSRIGV